MRLHLIAMMAGALALSACGATTPHPTTPGGSGGGGIEEPGQRPNEVEQLRPQAAAQTVTVRSTQGLIVAELAYNTAAEAVRTAVTTGVVRPGSPTALQLRQLNTTASRALEVARTARSSVDRAAALAQAVDAIASLRQLTPGVR